MRTAVPSLSLLLAAVASAAVETAVPATEQLLARDASRPVYVLAGYGYGSGERALFHRHALRVKEEMLARGPVQVDLFAVYLITTSPPSDPTQRRLDQQRAVRLAIQALAARGRAIGDGLLMDRDRFRTLYPDPPAITPGTPSVGAPTPEGLVSTGIYPSTPAVYTGDLFATPPGTTSVRVVWTTGYDDRLLPRHDARCELRVSEGAERGGAYRVIATGAYGALDFPVQPNTSYHFELYFTAPYTWRFGPESSTDYAAGQFVPFCYRRLDGPMVAPPPPPATILAASPETVSVAMGGLGSTTLRWVANGAYRLTVQLEGEPAEYLFAQGEAGEGSGTAPWIQAGRAYVFRLYEGSALVASTTVRGVAR